MSKENKGSTTDGGVYNHLGTKKAKETEDFALSEIQNINDALERREESSVVFNGVPYSTGYEYNQKKAVNYAPPKSKDDKEISMGIVHEKLIAFVSIFLKYVFKRQIKCYDNNGRLIERLGEVYDLAIEFSQKLEHLTGKIPIIYWELFSQGDAFVYEDWDVENKETQKPMKDKKELKPEDMDYTYEFIENLKYEKGKDIQTRKAISKLLDGREVILDDPSLDSGIQDQEGITIERRLSRDTARKIFGSLKMWKKVPKSLDDLKNIVGDKVKLFTVDRIKDPATEVLVHYRFSKVLNRYNIFVNGILMLPFETPLSIFYPRMNYPITQFSAERLSGSAYSRGIPAKTKFNADYVDFILKGIAQKFEQDYDPALLVQGRYTLIKDIFKAGQRTYGVRKDMYEFADPENKGLQNSHITFLGVMKDVVESQTVNPVTSGELHGKATATEISIVEQNQRDKLGIFLDGLMNGFMDMSLRRAETIESKYTIKQKETVVNGKKVSVYQNFTVSVSGVENVVEFEDELSDNKLYDYETKQDTLFQKSFESKKKGKATEYFLVNPKAIREGDYIVDIEIKPEKLKDSALQLIQMKDEFDWILNTFPNVDRNEMQKEYLKITGRTDKLFLPPELIKLQQQEGEQGAGGQGTNTGTLGKPTVTQGLKQQIQ